jgi:hypothetical protein
MVAELSLEDDRPLTLLYIGDHDPSGMHMSAVDLPGHVTRYGGLVEIRRIALTRDDVDSGRLPWFSADDKRKDLRHGWYVEQHGRRCWELDALDPNVLRQRVEAAIRQYINRDAWERCVKVEEVERVSLLDVVAAWKGVRQ